LQQRESAKRAEGVRAAGASDGTVIIDAFFRIIGACLPLPAAEHSVAESARHACPKPAKTKRWRELKMPPYARPAATRALVDAAPA
jgi:hypothetical protein